MIDGEEEQQGRIIKLFRLERLFKGHLVQPPATNRDIFHQSRLV